MCVLKSACDDDDDEECHGTKWCPTAPAPSKALPQKKT